MANPYPYIINHRATITGPRGFVLEPGGVERAVHRTRILVSKLAEFDVDVFALLGIRNLSAFVGEVFASAMVLEHPEVFKKNPHQDGYPDLLLLDQVGNKELAKLMNRLREKGPFSPFVSGGFEVKATCGSVPTPGQCQRRGYEKPDMGDQRIAVLNSYDWKAHHRETNYLFGLVWDFIEKVPAIVAVCYSSKLSENDWSPIIQPRAGGGRTTSVSIMTRDGVRKMYTGWVAVIHSEQYATFFDRRNGGGLMTEALMENQSPRTMP